MSASAGATAKAGRNDPCPCGSGKKFKHCCQAKERSADSAVSAGSRPSAAQRQRLRALFQSAKTHWDAGRLSEAGLLFEEILRLDPNRPEAHHDLGVIRLRCGKLNEAAASLQRAIELRPGFETALRHLVDTLEAQGREAEALSACRKLSRTAEDLLERRHFSAMALMFEGKLEEADKEFRRALAQAPQRAETRIQLGRLLAKRGMLEEASAQFTQAVETFPGAYQLLTEARRMTEADRPLAERMRGLADGPGLNAASRVCVRFGLGKAFDDLGDYAEAMRHYIEANRLKANSIRLDRAFVVSQYDNLITTFTADTLTRLGRSLARPINPGDDLPVLVVGMPRSGSTLVAQILSSHPEVKAAGELSFWGDRFYGWRLSNIGALTASALADTAADYRARLRQYGPNAARVIDKSPGNFERLWLIRLAFPDARIIHCRRHPVDTCLSSFFTNFNARVDYAWDRGDLVFYYRQYERLMDHWRRVLPADRFTEVQYERLIADREAATRRLLAFCGLEWDDACLAPERNKQVVQTASLWQVRQPVYNTSVERWRRYEPWLGELRALLPEPKEDPAG